MDLTEMYRMDCHTIISVNVLVLKVIWGFCVGSMMEKDPYGNIIELCLISTGNSYVSAGRRTHLHARTLHML